MKIFITGQKAFGAATLDACIGLGHEVIGVSSPPFAGEGEAEDRLRFAAGLRSIPWMPAGKLRAETLPVGVDLIIAAHSHDFIGRRTRLKADVGAIGYHPSLLPRHRGRDAVRWTLKMGDPVAGGTMYWLSDNMDAGDIAAQDWCWTYPDDTPESLWRRRLFPMGIQLLKRVLSDLSRGVKVAVPQDELAATWEPSWDRPPVRRPELLMIGSSQYQIRRDSEALQGS